jgi:hypothetical protein
LNVGCRSNSAQKKAWKRIREKAQKKIAIKRIKKKLFSRFPFLLLMYLMGFASEMSVCWFAGFIILWPEKAFNRNSLRLPKKKSLVLTRLKQLIFGFVIAFCGHNQVDGNPQDSDFRDLH